MWIRAISLLSSILSTAGALAAVNLSVTGPPVNNALGIFPFHSLAIPFTVGMAYSHVDIAPDLIGNFIGTAYLTTKVGSEATIADEIASSIFSSAGSFNGTFQTVLHDVTIPSAGTYYLVLSTSQVTPPQGLMETNFPVVVADAGNSYGAILASNQDAPYVPASPFHGVNGGGGIYAPEFILTSTVPEPATFFLLFLGIAVLGTTHRHK